MPRPRSELKKESFYFWRHDPGTGPLSEPEWKLQFEAHINSIDDTSSPNWNEYYDMGRADPKVMYGGFNRSYNINFMVIAWTPEEHKDNYEKILPRLGRITYPIYQSGYGYNAPHVLFQIGNLIKGYGVITNLTYSWNNESPWIENKPLYTDVNISIKLLADPVGKRPNADKSRYFF